MFVLEVAKSIRALGVEVTVLTTGNPAVVEHEGFPTRRLPVHRYRFNLARREIMRAAEGVDLIQTFNYHACLPSLSAARIMGKPVVCIVVGLFGRLWYEMKPFPFGALWQAFESYQLRRPFDRLVFVSKHSHALGLALGASPERSVVLTPGFDPGEFAPSPQKDDVVLFTGKFERRKGVYEVIEVARALPEVRFRLYGFGPDEAEVRRRAPANVEIEAYSNSAGLPDELARARICLLPSKAETFGYALLQAMASGCAIISSIPLPFDGIRVAPEDTQGMIAGVRQLWNSKETAERMGRANVETAKSYDWRIFGQGLCDIYRKVLQARPA